MARPSTLLAASFALVTPPLTRLLVNTPGSFSTREARRWVPCQGKSSLFW
jgi:hypothetical protein